MLDTIDKVTTAKPDKLASIAFRALSDDLTEFKRNLLFQIEFAEHFEEIDPFLREKVIRANINSLVERVCNQIEQLNIMMPEIDKLILLGKIRLISKSDSFQHFSDEVKSLVLDTLKEHNVK